MIIGILKIQFFMHFPHILLITIITLIDLLGYKYIQQERPHYGFPRISLVFGDESIV